MKYRLLLSLEKAEEIKALLEPAFECLIADENAGLLEQVRSNNSQMLLIDAEAILGSKSQSYHELKKDKVYYDVPVLACFGNLNEEQKEEIYTLDVKGVLCNVVPETELIPYIRRTF